MMMNARLAHDGVFLFRWRSLLPFMLLAPAAAVAARFNYEPGVETPQGYWAFSCLAISVLGLAIRVATIGFVPRGTSGRNTHSQKALSLNTTGMYSIVRNPLYLGNFIIWLGVVLVVGDLSFTMIYVLAFWLYYERIIATEEAFLTEKFGDEYLRWAAERPCFIPNFSKWQQPSRDFSVRTVLKKEYCGVFGITTGFFLMHLAQHVVVDRRFYLDTSWTVIFLFGLAVFVTLRLLRKKTNLLRVVDP